MLAKNWGSWRMPMGLCCVSLVLTLLYLASDHALGQIPPVYGYGYNSEPTVQFNTGMYTVSQGTSIAIAVTLSNTSTQTVSVAYATSDGTAQAGVDYTATSGTLTFPPGSTSQSFTVVTLADPNGLSTSTVNLTLSSPANATMGTISTATLSLVNSQSSCSSSP